MTDAPDSPPSHSPSTISTTTTTTSQAANSSSSRANGEGNTKINFGAPGSSWQTKKFSEEYDKVEASLLDRGWENKFGDPCARQ